MKKLSKKEALEICKDLWTWMRDEEKRSDLEKQDWPGWEFQGGDVPRMPAWCPICAFKAQEHFGGECKEFCTLKDLWPFNCLMDPSPFRPFLFGEGTPGDAQKIIDACNEELEKIADKK